jgi:hypothetical protein
VPDSLSTPARCPDVIAGGARSLADDHVIRDGVSRDLESVPLPSSHLRSRTRYSAAVQHCCSLAGLRSRGRNSRHMMPCKILPWQPGILSLCSGSPTLRKANLIEILSILRVGEKSISKGVPISSEGRGTDSLQFLSCNINKSGQI